MKTAESNLKIAILGSRGYPYVYSGYETLVKELGERLQQRGVEVTVYCHRSLFKERPKEVNGIRLVYMPAIEQKSLSQLTHTFFSMLHACFSSADVIFVVNSANGPFGLIAKLFGKPTAINVDGLEWLRPKWKGIGAKYFLWSSKISTKWYDHIINDADAMQKIYQDMFGCQSTVIAYGANPSYASDPEKIKKWNLEKQDYFLIVGRMVPDNNADLLVKGFVASNSQRKLVVVGDVPYQDAYASQLKQIKDERLVFTGYVTDPEELKALFHNCYAYYHGHEFGGTNPSMLKALGYGCAILALNTVFNQEMLQEGKYGWYFEKNEEAVRALTEKAENEPDAMEILRKTSREGLTKKYNWDHVTDQYLEVFLGLKSKKQRK